jgi:kynureninase
MSNLEEARSLDRLAGAALRSRFDIPDGLVYLDGNSLGPPLRTVSERVSATVELWRTELIAAWFGQGDDGQSAGGQDEDGWLELPQRVGRRLESLLGASPDSVVACDSTSVNLYKAVEAACDLRPGDILTDSGNFPTDLYVLSGIAQRRGRRLIVVEPDAIESAIDPSIGVVSLTQVDYRSGRLHDLGSVTGVTHAVGGLVVWDLSHTAGVMPIDLDLHRVDLAVGCGYKFLNGGPGAPAYIYVRPDLIAQIRNPIAGWFGHATPFDFSPEFVPSQGIGRMRVGTPHILSLVALEAALEVFDGVDLASLWERSQSLVGYFIQLVDAQLGERVEVITPRDTGKRGSQVSLRLRGAERLIESLATSGVVGDYRKPDIARFGLSALYNTHEEVWRAVAAIDSLV